ncbi:DUF6294 family protein [Thermoactinospora rubra]|uniref:DUF6294 family protein n=1 Tax=Thermoactinospora rubra TaxID=1088767 RepID=UPI00117E0D05|nr:DUF6294 family protein [Thermoactinospora rubra]
MSLTAVRGAIAAVATVALLTGLALSAPGTAQATTAETVKSFTWNRPMNAGDCTMFEGARWTLHRDGRAYFDGTVTSSDDNDAWLMWARLKDQNGAVLGSIVNNANQSPTDRTKFVKNLPSHTQRYRWFASGWFNPALFDLIKGMSLAKHC